MVFVDNVLKHMSLNLSSRHMYRFGAVTNIHVELMRKVPISVDVSKILWFDYFLLKSFPMKYSIESVFEIF